MSETIKKVLNVNSDDLNYVTIPKNEIKNNIKNTIHNTFKVEEVDLTQAEENNDFSNDIESEIVEETRENAVLNAAIFLSNPKNIYRSLNNSANLVSNFNNGIASQIRNFSINQSVSSGASAIERVSGFAFRSLRVLPALSIILEPLYVVSEHLAEGEHIEDMVNHKYEMTGALIGGGISAIALGAVLVSNPAGWVVGGVIGLSILGSAALEKLGAYYDNKNVIPVDYMSNVYFY